MCSVRRILNFSSFGLSNFSPKVSPAGQFGGGNEAMRSVGKISEKWLEPLLNKAGISLETECVRLGTVKLPRSIPTLASN
jgi:hypothetical protein